MLYQLSYSRLVFAVSMQAHGQLGLELKVPPLKQDPLWTTMRDTSEKLITIVAVVSMSLITIMIMKLSFFLFLTTKKSKPPVGIEPTTVRLRSACSAN
jgi:hypothetical protein